MRKKPRISSDATSSSHSQPREIPGFYYDVTKNRYFPIKPGQAPQLSRNEQSETVATETDSITPTMPPIYRMLQTQQTGLCPGISLQKAIYARWKVKNETHWSPWLDSGDDAFRGIRIEPDHQGCFMTVYSRSLLYTLAHNMENITPFKYIYDAMSGISAISGRKLAAALNGNGTENLITIVETYDDEVNHIKMHSKKVHGTPWRCVKPKGKVQELSSIAVASSRRAVILDPESIMTANHEISLFWKSHDFKSDVFSLDYLANERYLLSGLRNGQVVLNDLRDDGKHLTLKAENDLYAYEVYASQSGLESILVARSSGIYLYDARNPSTHIRCIYKQSKSTLLPPDRLGFCMSPDEEVLLTGTEDGKVVLLNPWVSFPNSVIKTWDLAENDHPEPVRAIAWNESRNQAYATIGKKIKTLSFS